MAKMESTLKNMLLSLGCITLVAAAALAGVYMLTLQKINTQKQEAEIAAQKSVLAGDENGTPIKVEVDGFGGKMVVMVGFSEDGKVLGYKVLEHSETPGLGDKAGMWFQNADKPKQNIVGRQATGQFTVSKDGGDVDAITAATISSRAFLKAVNQAYAEFMAQKGCAVEACSGTTPQVEGESCCQQKEECCKHHDGCCQKQDSCCKKQGMCCKKKCEHQQACCKEACSKERPCCKHHCMKQEKEANNE